MRNALPSSTASGLGSDLIFENLAISNQHSAISQTPELLTTKDTHSTPLSQAPGSLRAGYGNPKRRTFKSTPNRCESLKSTPIWDELGSPLSNPRQSGMGMGGGGVHRDCQYRRNSQNWRL